MLSQPLFEGRRVRLDRFNPDRDAVVAARWTHDLDWLQQLEARKEARPLAAAQVRMRWASLEKSESTFVFAVRLRADDRLVGQAALGEVSWMHRSAVIRLGIADPADRRQGFGGEALALLMRYAFDELNLHRLTAWTQEYNPQAVRFLERAGFVPEVRQRQALQRNGRRWDVIVLGLLREEWERARSGPGEAGP
jgi:RimJ/RimL family protein N-acetyltransferase